MRSAPSLFGIGIGLTIDEFALVLYLDDVYWSEQGRSSIDATVIAVAFMGLILLGVRPFDVDADVRGALIVSLIGRCDLLRLVIAICLLKAPGLARR